MSLGLSLRRPSADTIARFVDEQRQLDVTYADVGGTRTDSTPVGFKRDRWSAELGDASTFDSAKEGLRQWVAHRGAGVAIAPAGAPVRDGETVALLVRTGGLYMLASCRIVWTVDERDRFGFGYGTLPGHPESGEESFVIERRGDGTVAFVVTAFSRARHPVARLGGPITRALQAQTARGYLRGMQEWTRRVA